MVIPYIDKRVIVVLCPSGNWQWVGWGDLSPRPSQMGRLMIMTVCQVNVWFEEGLGFSPLGETGEGFVLKAGKIA